MGGTYLFDMFSALYRIDRKSKQWYRRVFYWVVMSTVSNSWIAYKRDCKPLATPAKEVKDLLSFATDVSDVLTGCDAPDAVEVVRHRGRPRNEPEEAMEVDKSADEATGPVRRRAYKQIVHEAIR